jgi:hypothetical protein
MINCRVENRVCLAETVQLGPHEGHPVTTGRYSILLENLARRSLTGNGLQVLALSPEISKSLKISLYTSL